MNAHIASTIRFVVIEFTAKGPKAAHTGEEWSEAMQAYSQIENGTFVLQCTEPNGTIVNDTLGRK